MAPRERGRNQTLCYRKCWSKLLLTKQTFDIFFSQSCDIKSEFSYIICSYFEKVDHSKFVEMHGDTSDFFRSTSKSDRYFFINCDLFIELLLTDLCLLQLENRLWTTVLVVLFHCCTLIWGLTNNNYNPYLLQFMTVSVNIRSAIFAFPS
jgi:hypothetical protein